MACFVQSVLYIISAEAFCPHTYAVKTIIRKRYDLIRGVYTKLHSDCRVVVIHLISAHK